MEDKGEKSPTKEQGGWFKITSEPYTPNKIDFNNFENWESNVWEDRSSEFKIGTKDEWKSIRFEAVNPPTEIKPKIDSSKKIESLKRGDIINFQQQEFLVERVKNEGIDVRDVNTGDVDFISTEDYINETQEQPIVEENVTNNQNTQEQGNEFTPEDLGLNTDSNQNDAVCK